MFIDEIKVHARAGHGGKGCIAFLREAFRPKGGPIGGDGGRGGDVVIRAVKDLSSLMDQYYHPRLFAKNGNPGLGKGMHGRSGKDFIVKVPCGTMIWKLPSKEASEIIPASSESFESDANDENKGKWVNQDDRSEMLDLEADDIPIDSEPTPLLKPIAELHAERELVADLTEDGQEIVLCKGGKGGLGNRKFASSTRQVPRFAQPGEAGDESEYLFELRVMADIGLVGYPNAGKSTLLTAISRAHPKIAAYPFTTLYPNVGIVDYLDEYQRVTVCDIPGLIEGAHENVGLGHEFLRHIRRCRALVLLIDMAGVDGRDPWEDYTRLLDELSLYDPELTEKPRILVANKMDEEPAETNLSEFKKHTGDINIIRVSAAFDVGMDLFKQAIKDLVLP